ncbi:MAG: 4Fe-4S dicluster domain-containing protein, partial [Planctomycetes bacterium]|nr:4Fe-4S dicluster domain-containing protein [Planctomycetota bacterium]
LVVEFFGETAEELPARVERLVDDLKRRKLGYHVYRAIEAQDQARIWTLRRAALGLSMSQRGDAKAISFVEDTAVSTQDLRNYIERFLEILSKYDTKAGFYAHASVGLLHIRPVVDLKTSDGVKTFEKIAEEVSDLVLEYGGALSGEHGDGLVRAPFQRKMFGPALYDAFCEIKRTFDSEGLFNPGKIVHAPPITENLRFGSDYETRELETTFDFSDFGGISRAAEQCGGVGSCRKTLGGTMCPSYMATREEKDSTRGRANVLRLAISGQLGSDDWRQRELHDVLDLCLECKACKSECPTGVDMARLKAEFLHQFHRKHGVPLRTRLLADVSTTAQWGSRFAPLSNWLLQSTLIRWMNKKFVGLDDRRILPKFSRQTFFDWWRSHQIAAKESLNEEPPDRDGPRIAIFADTFTNYFEPQHAIATAKIAERFGYSVMVPQYVCCGRPLISKGLLDKARRQAEETTRALWPLAEQKIPIVFCEPSCYSAVVDDHLHLLRDDLKSKAECVAAMCLTFEEWASESLKSRLAAKGNRIRFADHPHNLLFHGHCHQKALLGTGDSVKFLSSIPDTTVTELDAGCCGMAGSFGYEREHYAISQAIGERKLFPAIRDRTDDAIVVAPGFSCRHQIRHFTGVEAVSTAEWLQSVIEAE